MGESYTETVFYMRMTHGFEIGCNETFAQVIGRPDDFGSFASDRTLSRALTSLSLLSENRGRTMYELQHFETTDGRDLLQEWLDGLRDRTIVIQLCGGDKRGQRRDIEQAVRSWRELQQGNR